jgi:N-acetylglutamate synthase-like GNAT family acetyltransferase
VIQARKLQPNDLDYIFLHANSLGFDQKLMTSKLENMMVIVDNNEISGIGFYINYESKCILNWVFIKDGHRRNRLGTMLVKTMLNIAEQQGAVQAYMTGSCIEFAEYLGFQKVIDGEQISEAVALYHELYKINHSDNIFKVSLVDYFKPCSHKKSCI